MRQIPEDAVHRREEHQAADEQVAQRRAAADRDVDGEDDAHRERDRHVGVRELRGLEDVQEEGVARRLAELVAVDDEEEIEEQQRPAPAFAGLDAEEACERVRQTEPERAHGGHTTWRPSPA